MDIVDVLRIDHFRAFQNYWEIPAEEETAVNGKWLPGPGIDFFDAVESALGDIPILAEDLGIIDDSVRKLLEKTGCPGMGVMIFGLRAYEENDHMPHNWGTNRVGYTSTHDSETFVQTVENLSEEDRKFALEYVNANPSEPLGISAVRTAFSSSAKIAILMMADLLSLSDEGRINVPGTIDGNWRWRTKPEDFSEELAEELCRLTKTYKRNR